MRKWFRGFIVRYLAVSIALLSIGLACWVFQIRLGSFPLPEPATVIIPVPPNTDRTIVHLDGRLGLQAHDPQGGIIERVQIDEFLQKAEELKECPLFLIYSGFDHLKYYLVESGDKVWLALFPIKPEWPRSFAIARFELKGDKLTAHALNANGPFRLFLGIVATFFIAWGSIRIGFAGERIYHFVKYERK